MLRLDEIEGLHARAQRLVPLFVHGGDRERLVVDLGHQVLLQPLQPVDVCVNKTHEKKVRMGPEYPN